MELIGGVQLAVDLVAGKRIDDVKGAIDIEKTFDLFTFDQADRAGHGPGDKVILRFVLARTLMILPVAWLKVSTRAETVPSGFSDRFAEQSFGAVGVDLETKDQAAEFPTDDHVARARVWIGLELAQCSRANESTEADQPEQDRQDKLAR